MIYLTFLVQINSPLGLLILKFFFLHSISWGSACCSKPHVRTVSRTIVEWSRLEIQNSIFPPISFAPHSQLFGDDYQCCCGRATYHFVHLPNIHELYSATSEYSRTFIRQHPHFIVLYRRVVYKINSSMKVCSIIF